MTSIFAADPAAQDDAVTERLVGLAARAAARAVFDAFDGAGEQARMVGGCVRDAALGIDVNDIDIATPAPPERVMEIIQAAGLKAVPTGIKHGTITAVSRGQPFEITTLRHDVETDGRWAVVAFTDDWRADAARRDFTINAMSADRDGRVWDFFGGMADLAAGVVRFVGDPITRLTEDVLRLLRFYRFQARFGRGAPDPAAVAACRAMVDKLPGLSGERVRGELSRLLVRPAVTEIWRLMDDHGALAALGLTPVDHASLARLLALDEGADGVCVDGSGVDWVLALAAARPLDLDGALDLAARLKLSNQERDRLVAMARDWRLIQGLTPRQGAFKAGRRDRFADATRLAAAREGLSAGWVADRLDAVTSGVPVFPIGGRDMIKLGLTPGPEVGRLMASISQWWFDGDCRATRADCLARAKTVLGGAGDERVAPHQGVGADQ